MRSALILLTMATALAAQSSVVYLAPTTDTPRSESVVVSATPFVPTERTGGFGWVRIDVENRHRGAHELWLELRDTPTDGRHVIVRRRIEIPPKQSQRTATTFLRCPCSPVQVSLHLRLNELVTGSIDRLIAGGPPGFASLLIEPRQSVEFAWTGLLTRGLLAPPGRIGSVDTCRAHKIPTDPSALTAYDLVVVDDAASTTAELQQTLFRLTQIGGRLVVRNPAGLPAGALRDAWDGAQDGASTPQIDIGFGSVFVAPKAWTFEDHVEAGEMFDWLRAAPLADSSSSGVLHERSYQIEEVPGVSSVPTNVFFIIVFLYVLVVGPMTHTWFRRRGQGWMVLLAVPTAGFVVTAGILIWTVVSEGLGVQGSIRSFTFLDQREHRAVSHSRRTLFAGVSPTELTLQQGTTVATSGMASFDIRSELGYESDDDRGSLDGKLLPSRRPTTLAVAAERPCRARIRFMRQADRLELVDGDELRVKEQRGSIVLRDFQGRWWINDEGRLLSPVEPELAHSAYQALLQRQTTKEGGDLVSTWRVERNLTPGTWIAVTSMDPALDDLGVTVTWSRVEALVLGRLAEGDIVR